METQIDGKNVVITDEIVRIELPERNYPWNTIHISNKGRAQVIGAAYNGITSDDNAAVRTFLEYLGSKTEDSSVLNTDNLRSINLFNYSFIQIVSDSGYQRILWKDIDDNAVNDLFNGIKDNVRTNNSLDNIANDAKKGLDNSGKLAIPDA